MITKEKLEDYRFDSKEKAQEFAENIRALFYKVGDIVS